MPIGRRRIYSWRGDLKEVFSSRWCLGVFRASSAVDEHMRSSWQGSRFCSFIVLAIILGGCRIENNFVFHPNRVVSRAPSDVGLAFEEVFFTTQDGLRLHGWFIPHAGARATFVFFHGNAGNIGDRLVNLKLLHDNIKSHIFIFDYRGYGRSEGMASEEGTYLDGDAAIRYLLQRQEAGARQLVLFGRSLGAAIAAEMATRFDILGLILESPFVSIPEMARVIFPWMPFISLLRTRYDVVEKVRKINTRLLVLHGDRDEIIPLTQGKKVFDAALEPKMFHLILGAAHNDTFVVGGDNYFRTLRDFIETAIATGIRK